MKIHNHTRDVCLSCRPFVTMGAFDGIHLGHQSIFSQMKQDALSARAETVVVIFAPHPRRVLEPAAAFKLNLLTTLDEKKNLFEKTGIDHLVILPFTKALANIDYKVFVQDYLWDSLKLQAYYAGQDHGFGKGRAGGLEALETLGQQLGFSIVKLQPAVMGGQVVSSTRIRENLSQGNVREAATLLGYDYKVSGEVVMGNRIGHTIGYPTANLRPDDPDKMIPGQGVYAVVVRWDGREFLGMMNIGIRPTIHLKDVTIEINLFNFNQNIYGEKIEVVFVDRIREEKKFGSIQDLVKQLEKDKEMAQQILLK